MSYYVYMLRCRDGSVYTGITTDPERRLSEHKSGKGRAAGYTRSHGALYYIAVWKCSGRSPASKLEFAIKSLVRKQKEQIAQSGSLELLRGRISVEEYTQVICGNTDSRSRESQIAK